VRRVLIVLGALLLAAGGAAAGYVVYVHRQARDIRGSSTVEFVPTIVPVPAPAPSRNPETLRVPWPTYGLVPQRTRGVAGLGLRPPFRRVWSSYAGSLIEFPPSIGYGRLYFAANRGGFFAISARTGRRAWHVHVGRCVAASPAIDRGAIFEAFLNRPPCNASGGHGADGEVIAFSAGYGKIRWRTRIGPSETSPLVSHGLVYVGDWNGDVYALAEGTGRPRWRFHAGGAVKGGVALSGRRLYVGAYDGRLYCLDARTGKLIWSASSQPRLGSHGRFYSTPAVAYGRVYIGSTDGKVYSFGATSGKIRWSHDTGGYVYASPAVWNGLVLVGSYAGSFTAFDAATGDERWRFDAGGKISGSATVVDGVVYFATLERKTYALAARSGRVLWTYPDGTYTPVVADKKRLYLVGYGRIYGMVER
jgi:outer membrane protein assembly factor BamB